MHLSGSSTTVGEDAKRGVGVEGSLQHNPVRSGAAVCGWRGCDGSQQTASSDPGEACLGRCAVTSYSLCGLNMGAMYRRRTGILRRILTEE